MHTVYTDPTDLLGWCSLGHGGPARKVSMYAQERQQRILAEARRAGRVEVLALSEALGVAAETIRRDLTALEQRGGLRRVHGGALPVERLELEPTLATRTTRLTDEKRRIATRALEEIPREGTVLIDGGSTTGALVDLFPADMVVTVVTNSVPAASKLAGHPGVQLYLLGGWVRGITDAAVGEWATSALENLFVDVAFLGTNGFSATRGLTTPDQSEALVKTAMVRSARRSILLSDSSKSGDDYLHRFAHAREMDMVITDTELDPDVAAELRAAGPEVVLA